MPEPFKPEIEEKPEPLGGFLMTLGTIRTVQVAKALEIDVSQYPHIKPLIDTIPLIDESALQIAITFSEDEVRLLLELKGVGVFIRGNDFPDWKDIDKENIRGLFKSGKIEKVQKIMGDDSIFEEQRVIPYSFISALSDISEEGMKRIEELTNLGLSVLPDDFLIIDEMTDIHYQLLIRLIGSKFVQNSEADNDDYLSLERYRDLSINDALHVLAIRDGKDVKNIFWGIYQIMEDYPDFRLSNEMKDAEKFYQSFRKYLEKKFPIKDYAGIPPNDFIKRIFRIDDIKREIVRQKSSNCFLVAGLYGLIRNPYFLSELDTHLTRVSGNGFSTNWLYTFHDGVEYTIGSHDIRSDHKESVTIGWMRADIIHFAERIIKKYKSSKNIYHIALPPLFGEILERYSTKDGKPKKSLIQKIEKELFSGKGVFFEIWHEEERRRQSIYAIGGPIGYRILEAAYNLDKRYHIDQSGLYIGDSRKGSKELSDNGGATLEVFERFLSQDAWKICKVSTGHLGKIQLVTGLERLDSGQAIIGMSITKRQSNESPYFSIDGFEMAYGHAYTVKSYNNISGTIEVVNPWDTSKSRFFTIGEFLEIFDKVVIAFRK